MINNLLATSILNCQENVVVASLMLNNIGLFSVDPRLDLYVVVHHMLLGFGLPTYYW
jgi:hypothetical protein